VLLRSSGDSKLPTTRLKITGHKIQGRKQDGQAGCHAKLVAWTDRVIFPGIYNVSSGFAFFWLFGRSS